jgi:hypothetical protein
VCAASNPAAQGNSPEVAFTGIAYRATPKAPWWIAAFLLGVVDLKLLEWYHGGRG